MSVPHPPHPHSVVLARVNGEPVTQAQVDDVRAESRLAGKQKDADAALDEAIGLALVCQEAERIGLVVEETAVEERLAAVEELFGGEEALSRALQIADMSAEQLRRGAAHGLLREKLRDERFGDLAASAASVRAFYREHRDDLFTTRAAVDVSCIHVRSEVLAARIVKDARAGKRFAELARMYGRDPETKREGGRQGWVTVSSLPEPLRLAVEKTRKRGLAGPVPGPGGWFVLKLHDRRATKVAAFAAVKEELRAALDVRKRTQALDRWIAAERECADVELTTP